MHFQTGDAARLSGLQNWQVQSYAKQGFVKPVVRARGAGTRRAYDLIGLVKLAIINRLVCDGFDMRTVRDIFAGLFDIPALTAEDGDQEPGIRAWFSDKVMLTAEQFGMRKVIRRDRLAHNIEELLPAYPGLYIIDLGNVVGELLQRVSAFNSSLQNQESESNIGNFS